MIEINYRYEITVTYIDNVNEAFNPSFLGSQFIDRQYLTDNIFWYEELKPLLAKEFDKTHCLPVMVKRYDVETDRTKEYIVFQNINNNLQFCSLNNLKDIF